MNYLSVKNWEKFQHYKDRTPPWIKLHRELLDDYDFSCLQDASKAHLMLLWLLASQLDNKIPADEVWLKNKLGLTGKINLKELIDNGFLVLEQNASADVEQDASKPLSLARSQEERQRREETEETREKFVLPDFIPKKDWEDYCEMRRLIKKPMTSRAKSDAIHALSDLQAKGHPPADVLRQSIFNSWAGLFAIKADTGNSARTQKPNFDGPKSNVTVL